MWVPEQLSSGYLKIDSHCSWMFKPLNTWDFVLFYITSPKPTWNWAGPCGVPGHKSLPVSPLSWLQEIGFIQPPWPSLSSNGQIQAVAHQGREGTQRQGRNSQEKQWCSLGAGPGSASRDTCNNIFDRFADTESPTGQEKLTACCPPAQRPQTRWNQKVDDADFRWPHHQPIRRMSTSWSRPLWTMTIKPLTTPSRAGHTVLRAWAHCDPLCLAEQ